jgi:hypothetical protein
VFSVEELQEQEIPAVMEKELVQVSDILKEAYTKIEGLDLKCRNAVVAACYLEQVQLVLAHTLGGYSSKAKHYTKRQESAMFAICKVMKNSIKQYIPWKQFLYYCDQDDKIEAFLEFANKLEWKNKDNGV